eukprot:g1534.t1
MSLPREIFKWLQSLDLAYSVKNVKRDFSNGFLVAEIFSRYDTRNVQMHSYDNGISMKARKDNWELLQRYFRRRNFPVSQDEVNGIIYCKSGYVVPFLEKCYSFLTQRKIKERPQRSSKHAPPPFAQATASQAIKQAMNTELSELTDYNEIDSKVREKLDAHEDMLASTRSMDVDRYGNGSSKLRQSKVLRGETRQLAERKKRGQIQVKKVNVKHIDHANIAQLRLKQLSAQTSVNQPEVGGEGKHAETGNMRAAPALSIMSVLNEGVTQLKLEDGGVEGLVDRLVSTNDVDEDTTVAVFEALAVEEVTSRAANACIQSPVNYYKVSRTYCTALAVLSASSSGFDAAVMAFRRLGLAMVEADSRTTLELFSDYTLSLPRFKKLCDMSEKRQSLMEVVYSFVEDNPTAHIEAIRSLKDSLEGDMESFVFCLADMIRLERKFNDHLLDLYSYYFVIGIGKASARLRAACISMMAVFVEHKKGVAMKLLPKLRALTNDPYWEVRAQLLIVAAPMLRFFDSPSPEQDVTTEIVKSILVENCSESVKLIGLNHLLPTLTYESKASSNQCIASLLDLCTEQTLNMNPMQRDILLSSEPVMLEVGGGRYELCPVMNVWEPMVIVQQMGKMLAEKQTEYIELEQVELVVAATCSENAKQSMKEEPMAWKEVFEKDGIKDYIFIALCDPDCCELAVKVVSTLVYGPDLLRDSVLQAESLVGAMRLLFPSQDEGEPFPQETVCAFFTEALKRGGNVGTDLRRLLRASRAGIGLTTELQVIYDQLV